MSRDLYREIQEEADRHHRHHWQPGPMIAGWSSHAANDEGTPNQLVVLCGCGAIGRIEVPRRLGLPKGRRPMAVVEEAAS